MKEHIKEFVEATSTLASAIQTMIVLSRESRADDAIRFINQIHITNDLLRSRSQLLHIMIAAEKGNTHDARKALHRKRKEGQSNNWGISQEVAVDEWHEILPISASSGG